MIGRIVRYEVVTAGKVPSSGRFIVMKGNSDIGGRGLAAEGSLIPLNRSLKAYEGANAKW
ncbi:MAG: hypothetical protein CVU61_10330 [Deltaproteobacteria bacterium HGW-Deltaproteobacteria-19]|jgi:hypothetical protein|nr:MAG: hypothetical protein CVU61_10330 [Deltaproteobacteria bacterium HGW-Deltaproteobacteria-19]